MKNFIVSMLCVSDLLYHVSLAQTRLSERREEKIKEMKTKYERQLRDMKRELKQLELSKKEHSKAMKKNVNK